MCKSDENRNRICTNLKHLLSQSSVDLLDVAAKTGCTSDEVNRAKEGGMTPLEKQERMLKYFKVSLVTGALNDLGQHLTLHS